MSDVRVPLTDAQRAQIRDIAKTLDKTKEEVAILALMVGLGVFQAKKEGIDE